MYDRDKIARRTLLSLLYPGRHRLAVADDFQNGAKGLCPLLEATWALAHLSAALNSCKALYPPRGLPAPATPSCRYFEGVGART
jgi:hypothetical protein